MGPLVTIEPHGILYTRVQPGDVEEIVDRTLRRGEIVERLLYVDPASQKVCSGEAEIPFYAKQSRTVLAGCGHLDPEDILEYIHRGGYEAARRAFLELTPEAVCEEVLASGLRGRGGGGFPTGKKWEFTRIEPGNKKYVICNADEGDPGAFMDRSLMEGNPHAVIEGMMIAARGRRGRRRILLRSYGVSPGGQTDSQGGSGGRGIRPVGRRRFSVPGTRCGYT